MIFARIALADALGAVLAHSTRLPGAVLPKGAILTEEALAALAHAGQTHVTAARLEPGDVGEDEAAGRLAHALLAGGMELSQPARGRANLLATRAGLFRANAAGIDALNLLHEGLTIATLPDATPVRPGTLLVTVKIIPFAIPGALLAKAEALAGAAPPLRLPAFLNMRAGLVLTELPGLKSSVFRSTIQATRLRLEALTGTLLPPRRVPHAAAPIAAALAELRAEGAEILLIAGASATVDRLDEGPEAVVLAGGEITHFGMPVDPGNLMCLGRIGAIPVVVLPGCARSPSLNGIDLVLSRLFAAEPVDTAEISRMGVGGLLKDFSARPASRRAPAASKPRVAAIVLAAGLSSRMTPHNKLLLEDAHGQPMVARVVDRVLASRAHPVHVVLGHQANAVAGALAGRDVALVEAPDYALGMSASLRAGLAALAADAQAVLICLADMPLVTEAQINRLLDAYDPDEGRLIVVPTHGGTRGNPVLWDRRFIPEIAALTGDTGARALLLRHAESVVEVDIGSRAVLTDFDEASALEGAGMAYPAFS